MNNMRDIEKTHHMNILCSCDTNYVPCCGIMLTSLFENNKDAEIDVYIFTGATLPDGSNKLVKLANQYGQNIRFMHISDAFIERCPIYNNHLTTASYYRLFAAEYLPEHIDKILYLDCDIIVNKSLSTLYDTDIANYSAAVVQDSDFYVEERNRLLELSPSHIYFNAGVMLLNLAYWRNHNLTTTILSYVNSHADILHTHDQDVLNYVLQSKVMYLPIKYNFQTLFLHKRNLAKYDEALRSAIKGFLVDDIVIWHYDTAVKPWNCWYFAYPNRGIWEKYEKLSNWRNWKQKHSLPERLRCHILAFLYMLRIKNADFESVPQLRR